MPTFQTTPVQPWLFPDQAVSLNRKGMQPLPYQPEQLLDLLSPVESEAHKLFSDHEHSLVSERFRVNRSKERGMLGLDYKNARSQREILPASRSSVPNGVFHGSPMTYVTSAGLRGGVITSSEGKSWLAQRLKQRGQEYAERTSGNFPSTPPVMPDVTPYNDVETLLQAAFTAFTAGSFTSSLNETLNKLLQSFIRIGAKITPAQLTTYSQAIGKMIETTRSYSGANLGEELGLVYEGREKRLRYLDSVNETLKIIDAALKEIARVIYEPESARQLVMSQLQSRLIGKQLEQFKPSFTSEERQGAIEAVGPVELGTPSQPGPLLPPRPAPRPMGMEESAWSVAAPSSAASVMSSASTPRTSASAAQSVAPPAGDDEECAVDGSGRRRRPYNFRF
jgi:hypothetical protein